MRSPDGNDKAEVYEALAKKYPEHTKLRTRRSDANILSDFLDYLEKSGRVLCDMVNDEGDGSSYYRSTVSKADLIGPFLGVNPRALKSEKEALYQDVTGLKL